MEILAASVLRRPDIIVALCQLALESDEGDEEERELTRLLRVKLTLKGERWFYHIDHTAFLDWLEGSHVPDLSDVNVVEVLPHVDIYGLLLDLLVHFEYDPEELIGFLAKAQ